MADSLERSERRIVIEVLTPEAVQRLEARDEALRVELQALENRVEGLHATMYELLEAFGDLKRRR